MSPNSGNHIAKGKGVYLKLESERSRRSGGFPHQLRSGCCNTRHKPRSVSSDGLLDRSRIIGMLYSSPCVHDKSHTVACILCSCQAYVPVPFWRGNASRSRPSLLTGSCKYDMLVKTINTVIQLVQRKVTIFGVDRLELAAIDGDKGFGEQMEFIAVSVELPESFADGFLVLLTKIGDCSEVRCHRLISYITSMLHLYLCSSLPEERTA